MIPYVRSVFDSLNDQCGTRIRVLTRNDKVVRACEADGRPGRDLEVRLNRHLGHRGTLFSGGTGFRIADQSGAHIYLGTVREDPTSHVVSCRKVDDVCLPKDKIFSGWHALL